jgi:hypothetical protein
MLSSKGSVKVQSKLYSWTSVMPTLDTGKPSGSSLAESVSRSVCLSVCWLLQAHRHSTVLGFTIPPEPEIISKSQQHFWKRTSVPESTSNYLAETRREGLGVSTGGTGVLLWVLTGRCLWEVSSLALVSPVHWRRSSLMFTSSPCHQDLTNCISSLSHRSPSFLSSNAT